ncbi:E3 ubiquitin-protein ligase RHA1B-like [Senna tora]|uniref:E3 ubiquitin-protein ligase RHA1B-like n=1 Tax=Senna tora TaxID=362788 RepID=A0A835CBU2_9FABA|nr:E3 ubiquitin-protein ligase RHA1B-like [Senna tora]
MGFLWPTIRMPEFTSIKFLTGLLLHQIKSIMMIALHHLGPSPSQQAPPLASDTSTSTNSRHVLILDGLSPTLVPLHVVISLIKQRLPIIEYNKFLERSMGDDEGLDKEHKEEEEEEEEEEEQVVCAVCLDMIEGRHKIREISNCCHIFHRECLDRWLEENQITCPLCRTMLFPANKGAGQTFIHYYH